jgi:hypothetical protein
MNKAQKEVQQTQLDDESKTIRELKQVYSQARKDCEQKIRDLSSRTDLENLQSIIYQKQYQEAIKKQLDGIIDNLSGQQFTTVADYLQQSYYNGYTGAMYDLHQQGIPIVSPINQKQVAQAIQTDSKISKGLYSRLGEDTDYLKRSIRAELSRGISNGSSWNEIAGHIANGMNSPFNRAYNNAIRISRTEGHRIQQKSALDAQVAAKDSGAEVVKQWCATLDDATRETHQQLDGQIREVDEDFEVNGMTAPYPGGFGDPSEDCNCRCCILQRAKWALDQDELATLEERAAYFGLDKTSDFDEFKDKYLHLPDGADTMDLEGIKLGELEDAYGKKHSAAITKELEDAPQEIRAVWNYCADDFHAIDPKYRGSKAYYSASADGVKLNISSAAKGSDYQTPYQVVFHEYGHNADYILNREFGNGDTTKAFSETYKDGVFGKTLKEEANKAIEEFAKSQVDRETVESKVDSLIKRGLLDVSERDGYIDNLLDSPTITDQTKKDFCTYIKEELTLMQRSDISDMFEPVMPGSCAYPFGVGHGSSYWNNRDNGKEGFAEMYSAAVNNPESLEQIQKYFPESYKIFQEMIGVVQK